MTDATGAPTSCGFGVSRAPGACRWACLPYGCELPDPSSAPRWTAAQRWRATPAFHCAATARVCRADTRRGRRDGPPSGRLFGHACPSGAGNRRSGVHHRTNFEHHGTGGADELTQTEQQPTRRSAAEQVSREVKLPLRLSLSRPQVDQRTSRFRFGFPCLHHSNPATLVPRKLANLGTYCPRLLGGPRSTPPTSIERKPTMTQTHPAGGGARNIHTAAHGHHPSTIETAAQIAGGAR